MTYINEKTLVGEIVSTYPEALPRLSCVSGGEHCRRLYGARSESRRCD